MDASNCNINPLSFSAKFAVSHRHSSQQPSSSLLWADHPSAVLLQTLVANELRERVTLRVDGGMRSGRDVLISAALGGDEFGFGTVAMIATGCIMARVCHTNNCPVGVASQREELRARFPGAPGDLVSHA